MQVPDVTPNVCIDLIEHFWKSSVSSLSNTQDVLRKMELKRKKIEKGHVEFAEQMCANYSHSTLQRFIAQRDVHLSRIDKPLLVFKIFYFFVSSSVATTFPFLPSYFRQIGFSSHQVQVLVWVRPFVQLFLSPLWGLLADRCLPKKIMLQFCTFVWLIGTISLAFVEPTGQMCQLVSLNQTDSTVINSTEMQTGFFRRRRASEYLTMQSKLIPSKAGDFERVEVTIGSGSGLLQVSGSGTGEPMDPSIEVNATKTNKSGSFVTFYTSHQRSEYKESPAASLMEFNFTTRNELRENTSRLYHIFLGALALVVFEEIFFCPVFFVTDAVLLAKQVEEGTVVFGHQKMFSSVGFLILFLITGTVVNNSQRPVCGHIYADYVINFCFFCVLTIVTLLVLIQFEIPQRTYENSPYERLKTVYYTKHYGTFIATTAFMGFSHTVIVHFHTAYLAQTKVSHATSATINLFRFLGEPLAFLVSHKLINRIGNINVIFASLVLYMFNHFACSFVTNSWQIIPLGFMEGFTFGSSFVVSATYLANSSPLDCLATVQGVFQSIYWGLGGILGLMIGAGLIRVVGPAIAFRLFTVLTVIFIVIFTTGLTYVNFRNRNYYSVLQNTFNICIDTNNPQQNDSENANNTLEKNAFNDHLTTVSFGSESGSSDSRKGDWDKY